MKKLLFSVVTVLLTSVTLQAQVGIGTQTPEGALDVVSTNSGVIVPRVDNLAAVTTPVPGMIVYDLSEHCIKIYSNSAWTRCLSADTPVTSLNCSGASRTGVLKEGATSSGVSFDVEYAGNGDAYAGETVASTGVTGLTATLAAGTLATGTGTVSYTISGTPVSTGGSSTASFAISLGGQSCIVAFPVIVPIYCTGSGGATAVVEKTGAAGATWMDRNLGATKVAASLADTDALGGLYQWGRFTDGHQCRDSDPRAILSSTDSPEHGDFISSTSNPYDWRSSKEDNLWQGVNGINNPCPNGYRLPTRMEWNAERLMWSSNDDDGAFAALYLTNSGFRNAIGGSVSNENFVGQYWSSTVNNAYVDVLRFDNADAKDNNIVSRGNGMSVRCIKHVP